MIPDETKPLYDQARTELRFDDTPRRFRAGHPDEEFSDASGVLFEQAMSQTRMAICLCDPRADDHPIVFANRAFRALTGYDEQEIVGRNCRFLQGPGTEPEAVERIRNAIRNQDAVVVELLNYRKDGTPFWNALHLGPIYDAEGALLYFFGSQWDVSEVRAARSREQHAKLVARELSHRMKNMFAVISGIVNITGRMRGVRKEAEEINSRIQALGRAYETTLDEASGGSIALGPAIRAILRPYDPAGDRLRFVGNGLCVPFTVVSTVGLVLHELAANASKYGAWSAGEGEVEVDWSDESEADKLVVCWRESGGPRVTAPDREGTGTALIDRMLRAADGKIERRWNPDGLDVLITLSLPGTS